MLHLIARLNIGGPAVLVIDLASGLDKDRFDLTLAAGEVKAGEDQMDFWANNQNVKWINVPGLTPELTKGNLTAWREVRRLIKQVEPDILHTHTAKAGTIGRLAVMGLGRRRPKVVHTFHGHVLSGYFSEWKSGLFNRIERWLAKSTDRVIVLSQEQAHDICQLYSVCPPDKTRIIPNGLDFTRFLKAEPGRLRAELGLRPDKFLLGFIGRLTKIKNPHDVIRAIAQVNQNDREAHLIVVGQGELESELRNEADALGLDGRIHFLGWREKMESVYSDLDLVALVSQNEGLPLVLLEAMAAGRPVVSTLVGGAPSLLGIDVRPADGGFAPARRGMAVRRGDPYGLARAIEWVMDNPGRAAGLAGAGRDYVLDRHGQARFLDAHARLYLELMEGR